MNKKRRISVEFENKKYPLNIKDTDTEERFYRKARERLQARVFAYKFQYAKSTELHTPDFYVMAAFQFALESLFDDSFMEGVSQLSDYIDEYLQQK